MNELISWIDTETKTNNFGDKRLNKRFTMLLNKLSSAPNKSIPAACHTWTETLAAYRFFNNPEVTQRKILSSHRSATIDRIKQEKIVLIPQDTTDISFTGRKPIDGMGYLDTKNSQGFYLHPSLAITPQRLCLGVIDLQTWTRKELGLRKKRQDMPIEKKETYCWLKGYEAANEVALASPNTIIVSVCDRGGDIYELLEKMPSEKNKAFWLIRSNVNRKIVDNKSKNNQLKLWDAIKSSKPIGIIEFELPVGKIPQRSMASKKKARQERLVRQEIRIGTLNLNPPYRKRKNYSSTIVHVVHCKEINSPNEEDHIEWFLLTSFPVNDTETALDIVKWYLCRWQIEIFFKVLKSGCTIEELQFENLKATTNCVALYAIIAWRILYLTTFGRTCPDMKCDCVFETNEWQSVYVVCTKKPPPQNIPNLNEIILMIAKLGGFLGRGSDGYPGVKVMWVGMQRMRDFTLAWEASSAIR